MPPSQREVKDKAESFVGFFLFKRKKEILVLHEMFLGLDFLYGIFSRNSICMPH